MTNNCKLAFCTIGSNMLTQHNQEIAQEDTRHFWACACEGLGTKLIPCSGYFSGNKILVSSEFWASSWKNVCGHRILNHTPCMHGVEMACYFEVEAMVRVAFFHKIWKQGNTES